MVVLNDTTIYQKTGPNPEDKEIFYPKTTWSQVIEKPSWIGDSKPSYTWSDITGKPDILLYSAQSLTDAQKAQARTNIGAGTPYTLPTATATVLGGVKSSTTGTTKDRDYLVQVNADGTMKVNVPWTDTQADLSNFVTLDTEQTISGRKIFTENIYVGDPKGNFVFVYDNGVHVKEASFQQDRLYLKGYGETSVALDSQGYIDFHKDGNTYFTYHFPEKSGTLLVDANLTWDKVKDKPDLVLSSQIGVADGVASLGTDGKVPTSQLPGFVDDVEEYASKEDFPAKGESGKIYVAMDTNLTYRWGGTEYVEISPSLALGETSSTAYAGNKGKANADAIAALQKAGNVRYDTAQSLTDAQKQQARTNIGAGTPYTLPTATATVLGGVKSSTTGTTKDRDYLVQVNADGTMKVNVPWTDTQADLSNFVTLDTEQTISGKKKFTNGVQIGSSETYSVLIKEGEISIGGNSSFYTDSHDEGSAYLKLSGGSDLTVIGPHGEIKYYAGRQEFTYHFPEKSGTLLVDTDLPESLPPTGSAGGDLTGTYPNPTIKEGAVDDTKLSKTGVTAGYYSAVQTNEQGRIIKGANIFMSGTSETIPSNLATSGLYFYITNSRTVA